MSFILGNEILLAFELCDDFPSRLMAGSSPCDTCTGLRFLAPVICLANQAGEDDRDFIAQFSFGLPVFNYLFFKSSIEIRMNLCILLINP